MNYEERGPTELISVNFKLLYRNARNNLMNKRNKKGICGIFTFPKEIIQVPKEETKF